MTYFSLHYEKNTILEIHKYKTTVFFFFLLFFMLEIKESNIASLRRIIHIYFLNALKFGKHLVNRDKFMNHIHR